MISIIVRTKNEEEWIRRCLIAIVNQDYEDIEIILVDNESSDRTLEVAKKFDCKILTILDKEFTYGKSLNMGIKESKGEFIVLISAHCIPLNNHWLNKLVENFEDKSVAGVYGRQEPLPDSDPFDKRDLWTTFGVEKKIQLKDYFFHNANSMIRKSVWKEIPFDEKINGLEDRCWAKKVISHNYKIVYEPEASVYHFHGIHQGKDEKRAERVAKIIELLENEDL